jgi:hypothetical protein
MAETWRQVFTRHQRALPKTASFQERGQATRRAADEYHGRTRSNPDRGDLKKIAIGGAIAFAAYKLLGGSIKLGAGSAAAAPSALPNGATVRQS